MATGEFRGTVRAAKPAQARGPGPTAFSIGKSAIEDRPSPRQFGLGCSRPACDG